jgi:plasmid maintenance system antidote protein VapI
MSHETRGSLALKRKVKEYGQEYVASCIGVQRTHVSRLVSGARGPSFELAARIKEAFGVSVAAWSERVKETK